MPDETPTLDRAWRLTLNPTREQAVLLAKHAGAARWAYNLALGAKIASREIWEKRVAELVDAGIPEADARKQVKVRAPSAKDIDKARVRVRGTDRLGNPTSPDWVDARRVLIEAKIDEEVTDLILTRWAERAQDPAEGIAPWLAEVPNGLVQRAEKNTDKAWQGWMDSVKGKRAGRRVGFPRFKKRGYTSDSFYLTNTEAGLVPGSNRDVRLGGKLGVVRVCDADGKRALRRLHRHLRRTDCRVMSVTVSRGGHRWYASIQTTEPIEEPRPTRRAAGAGTVAVHLGVRQRATLSTGETIENPRVKATHARAVAKAQRALARTVLVTDDDGTQHPSRRREKARRRLARLTHLEALRRGTHTHHVSKRIATGWAEVVLLDLDIQGMTRTAARCRPPLHGWDAQAKRDGNRAMLDVAPYELRRQLEYKTAWLGARSTIIPKGTRIVNICPDCGATVKPKRATSGSRIICSCGARYERGHAAALVLLAGAAARNRQEALNARGGDVRPDTPRGGGRSPVKREGPRTRGSPPGSDARTFPTCT